MCSVLRRVSIVAFAGLACWGSVRAFRGWRDGLAPVDLAAWQMRLGDDSAALATLAAEYERTGDPGLLCEMAAIFDAKGDRRSASALYMTASDHLAHSNSPEMAYHRDRAGTLRALGY